MNRNLNLMNSFTEENLPSLKTTVLGALELFIEKGIPKLDIKGFEKPLVIGSGNAYNTGKMLFDDGNASFADENTFQKAIKSGVSDSVIICSASGSKHAGVIAKEAVSAGLPVRLICCNKNSEAEQFVGKENTTLTPRNLEPYTYNTSTYMGWILSQTGEDVKSIYDFINREIKPILDGFDFRKYKGFFIILPNHLGSIKPLSDVKFTELFGRILGKDTRTFEDHKHATTVVPSETELLIKFGEGDLFYDGDLLNIPLPDNIDKAGMMAIAYYTIGEIQEQLPDYFRQNIKKYIEKINKTEFGKNMKIIV